VESTSACSDSYSILIEKPAQTFPFTAAFCFFDIQGKAVKNQTPFSHFGIAIPPKGATNTSPLLVTQLASEKRISGSVLVMSAPLDGLDFFSVPFNVRRLLHRSEADGCQDGGHCNNHQEFNQGKTKSTRPDVHVQNEPGQIADATFASLTVGGQFDSIKHYAAVVEIEKSQTPLSFRYEESKAKCIHINRTACCHRYHRDASSPGFARACGDQAKRPKNQLRQQS
jgi:hypothetical protein